MVDLFRKIIWHPALISTLLWGLFELIALQGLRRARKR